MERWQLSRDLAGELDQALEANAQIAIEGYVVAPSMLEVPE
jgi:hypothetical protein